MRSPTVFVRLVLALVIPIGISCLGFDVTDSASAQDLSTLPLTSTQVRLERLGPDALTGSTTFIVDTTPRIEIVVTSASPGLITSIVTPTGQTVDANNVAAFGGGYAAGEGAPTAEEGLHFFDTPGHHITYSFPTFGPGTYVVNFEMASPLANEPVFARMMLDSPVKATLFSPSDIMTPATPAVLVAAVFEDGANIGGTMIDVVVSGGGIVLSGVPVSLRDDGVFPDGAAGDGLYSAFAPSLAVGEYSAVAKITGTDTAGNAFLRHVATTFTVRQETGRLIAGPFSDAGVDTDGNGRYEFVRLGIPVDIALPGNYRLSAILESASGEDIRGGRRTNLSPGTQTFFVNIPAAEFVASGEDGPYTLTTLSLIHNDSNGATTASALDDIGYLTAPYLRRDFERPPLALSGNNSEQTVDVDGDGLDDRVDVSIGIDVTVGGTYNWRCQLETEDGGIVIEVVEGTQTFAPDTFDGALLVSFDGRRIRAAETNGPYKVRSLLVDGPGGGLSAGEVMCTKEYSFETFAAQDGHAILVVVANNTGQPAADLHLVFRGAGGNLFVDARAVISGNCPLPDVTSNPPAITDTVDIDWHTPCVADGQSAALIVQTTQGPLEFVRGWWTDASHQDIGSITRGGKNSIHIFDLFSGPPSGGSGGRLKLERVYVPITPITYSDLYTIPGRPCWFRDCCVPWQRCFYRVSRDDGMGNCIPITGWIYGGMAAPYKYVQRVTNPKEEDLPNPSLVPVGAPPLEASFSKLGEDFEGFHAPWRTEDVSLLIQADGSVVEEVTFVSTFRRISRTLGIVRDENSPADLGTVSTVLAALATRMPQAAAHLTPLVTEMNHRQTTIGDPAGDDRHQHIADELTTMQSAMTNIGTELANLPLTNPAPFANLRDALTELGELLASFSDEIPGREHARDDLVAMARGLEVSREAVADGIDTDPNHIDYFLWGLQNRFQPLLKHFADAMKPHIRITLDLGHRGWFPSTVSGVLVHIQDAETKRVVERKVVPVSDSFAFDVPHLPGRTLNIWFKFPGCVSRMVQVVSEDGAAVSTGPLIAGDVDGDDDIDQDDLDAVIADLSEGGPLATSVPATDVNANGIVDITDARIVFNHLGHVGDALPAPSGVVFMPIQIPFVIAPELSEQFTTGSSIATLPTTTPNDTDN